MQIPERFITGLNDYPRIKQEIDAYVAALQGHGNRTEL